MSQDNKQIESPHYLDAAKSPEITWCFLRSLGFRFTSHGVDNVPHMVLIVDSQKEVAIEVSPSCGITGGWTLWIRSDIAFAKCRFCFLRNVSTERQITGLIEAITDRPVAPQEFDREAFADSLLAEQADCRRRYKEYANGNRYGRIPGGM